MKPALPVIPGEPLPEIVFGESQDEYSNLPAVIIGEEDDRVVLSRWKCSIKDRIKILLFGNVYHSQLIFSNPPQPVFLQADKPKVERVFSFNGSILSKFKRLFNFSRDYGWMKTPRGWLCWDFTPGSFARIYWSKDGGTTPESGVRVLLR